MNLSELKIGTRIGLVVSSEIPVNDRPSLVSEFEWADEDNQAYIAAPILEGVIYPIKIGANIEAYFIEKLELYKFNAEVLNRGVKDNIALLKIKIIGGFERIQRRQYFRFDCSVFIKYREINIFEDEEENQILKKALTRDLSGGGLCLLTDVKLETGKILGFELKLDENLSINFLGTIIRTSLSDRNEKYNYEIGISFKKIENKDREALIRYIFNEQRKLRQKGLI